ncbi:H-NS family nucleoid-associated regulatory protein [Caballeronia temeraria]|nr:H-NS family nucleoid-associated regulatory protein [Caballeronia temeraria]
MVTLKGLQDKIAKLQAQAEAIAKKESSAVLGKIRDLMEKHGLTPDDIAAHFSKQKRAAGRKSAAATKSATSGVAKYVDPKTGATWTGHGRAPAWIATAKNRDKFLASATSQPAAVAERKPKAGDYVRGPQAPKYRDPASGETWSGRGRAPAWLAAAKDRTQFLIEKPELALAKSESAPPVKNATKKVAGKKAAKKTASKKAAVKKTPSTKSAKKAVNTASSTGKKAALATKNTAAKKAPVRRASTKQVAAKKLIVAEAPTPAVEPNVSGVGTSV